MSRLAAVADQRSLQERTYEALRTAILEGELLPGERLFEAALAESLGVSRNPVREAVRRLQQDGLIASRPHYGIYVAEIPATEIEDVYLIRAALEGTAAALAASRMTADELEALEAVLADQRRAAQSDQGADHKPVSVVQADRFHQLIHEGARSPRLLVLLEQIYAQVTHFRKLTLRYPGRAAVSAAGHTQIYEALRARDAATAERLMRGHVDGARLTLVRELAEIEQAKGEAATFGSADGAVPVEPAAI